MVIKEWVSLLLHIGLAPTNVTLHLHLRFLYKYFYFFFFHVFHRKLLSPISPILHSSQLYIYIYQEIYIYISIDTSSKNEDKNSIRLAKYQQLYIYFLFYDNSSPSKLCLIIFLYFPVLSHEHIAYFWYIYIH